MKKDKTTKVEGKGEVSMSLYEINQSIISQLPPYDEEKINDLMERLSDWDVGDNYQHKYYMLLNNDKHYYTVFHYEYSDPHTDFPTLGKGTIYLLQEMGYDIVSDEIQPDHCEIWVKNDQEVIAYLLFPYDQGVVTYG